MESSTALSEPERPYTIAEAAHILNVAEPTIRKWVLRRRIAALRIGTCVRIPAHEIRRLLSA
jgi:excisionase family DNA binding protein